MTKKKLPVRFTGQHFTIDKVLIKDAIRQANISNQDTVLGKHSIFRLDTHVP